MKIIRFIINKPIFQYKISSSGLLPRMTVFFFLNLFHSSIFSSRGFRNSRQLEFNAGSRTRMSQG